MLWGGLLNLSTPIGANTRLMLNNTYNRTSDNDARRDRPRSRTSVRAHIDRLQYVERSVRSNQLAAEHQIGTRHRIDWSATSSGVTRDEPDRSEFVSVLDPGAPNESSNRLWLNTGNQGAVRTFATLDESSAEGRLNYQLTVPWHGRDHSVKVGGLYRSTDRDADSRAFSISAAGVPESVRALPPEQLFDGRFTQGAMTVFDLAPLGQGGSYEARDRLSAGFAMVEFGISDRFRLIGGARLEHDKLHVDATSTLGAPVDSDKDWTDVLPSAALNVRLTERQSLRLSLSRTLARPEYRELSPVISRDVIGGDNVQGDPNLERTRIANADLRWEWYPDAGEVVSVALFGKQFDKPIERVYRPVGSGARTVFHLNAEGADNYGVNWSFEEHGLRRRATEPATFFTNLTVIGDQARRNDGERDEQESSHGRTSSIRHQRGSDVRTARGFHERHAPLQRTGERIDAARPALRT